MDSAPTARDLGILEEVEAGTRKSRYSGVAWNSLYEELQALSSLVKTLERRSDTFRTAGLATNSSGNHTTYGRS